jgi:hypothetical protein
MLSLRTILLIFFSKCTVPWQCAFGGLFSSVADTNPDAWDRTPIWIQILALINNTLSTFVVCIKDTYCILNLLGHISAKKMSRRKLAENIFMSGTGSSKKSSGPQHSVTENAE